MLMDYYCASLLSAGPLSLLHGADNYGKIWSPCGQH